MSQTERSRPPNAGVTGRNPRGNHPPHRTVVFLKIPTDWINAWQAEKTLKRMERRKYPENSGLGQEDCPRERCLTCTEI